MFRWCSYCQHFIGEAPPFELYSVTHGICPSCEKSVEQNQYNPTSSVLLAQKIFHSLFSSKERHGLSLPDEFFREALEAGIKPSELVLGVLQPALYWIGVRWERGLVTPAEEHDFSAWCEAVLDRFLMKSSDNNCPTTVLTTVQGNVHNLGIRFLATYLSDHGIACRVIMPSLTDDKLLEFCVCNQPAFCGISVALPEGLPRAKSLANKIRLETSSQTKTFLGGFACRQQDLSDLDIPVFNSSEDLLRFLIPPQ